MARVAIETALFYLSCYVITNSFLFINFAGEKERKRMRKTESERKPQSIASMGE